VAYDVLSNFDFEIDKDILKKIISSAYGNQWHNKEITPVKQI
jgi:hypothetical protein